MWKLNILRWSLKFRVNWSTEFVYAEIDKTFNMKFGIPRKRTLRALIYSGSAD